LVESSGGTKIASDGGVAVAPVLGRSAIFKGMEQIVAAPTNNAGGTSMATTSAQRVRAHRVRRRRCEVQLTIEVSEIDLREIALAGYAGAAFDGPEAAGGRGRRLHQRPVLQSRDRGKRR
jgi:hypothetical protein